VKRKMARQAAPKRKSPSPAKRSRSSPVARVKRVTREVVEQATTAVTTGVETLKDLGENIAGRVRSEFTNRQS
jgi:hypothetical protein